MNHHLPAVSHPAPRLATLRAPAAALALCAALIGCGQTADLHYINGHDAFKQRDYAKALQELDLYLEKAPMGEHADNVLFLKGLSHIALQQRDQGLAALERMVRLFPRSPVVNTALMEIANANLANGQVEKAIDAYQRLRLLAADPMILATARERLIALYVDGGTPEAAIALIESATDMGYKPIDRMLDKEAVWRKVERYDQAMAAAEETISATWATPADRTIGLMTKASLLGRELGDATAAIDVLRQLRAEYPNEYLANWSLAEEVLFQRQLDPRRAEETAAQAIAAYEADIAATTEPSRQAWYYDRIAKAYELWGDLPRALETYEHMAQTFSSYPEIWQTADAYAKRLREYLQAAENARAATAEQAVTEEQEAADDPHLGG